MLKSEKDKKWDQWYLDMCDTVASNSKCLSRKIGAVLVRDKSIISTGYNGPPRGDGFGPCSERWVFDPALYDHPDAPKRPDPNKCPRQILGFKSGEGVDYCIAGHAERNALINAARLGIPTKGTTMYMDCDASCTPCLIEIINAGVEEIVMTGLKFYDTMGEYVLKRSGIKYRTFFDTK